MANTAKQVTLIEATIDIKVGRSAAAFNSLADSLEKIAGNNGLLESTVAGFSLLNATLAEGSSQYESFATILSRSKNKFRDIKKSIDGAVAGFGKIAGAKEAVFDPTPSQLSNLEEEIKGAIRRASSEVNISFDADLVMRNLQDALRERKLKIFFDVSSAVDNLQNALLRHKLKILADAEIITSKTRPQEKETSPFTKRGGLSTGTQQEKAVRSILIKELQKADFSAEKLDATIKEITDSLRNLGGANTQVDQVTKALAQLFRRSLQAKVSLDELNEADKFTALTTLGRSAREFLKEFGSALSKADTLKVKAIASFEELAEKGGGSFSKLNKTAQKTISAMYKELVGSSIIPDGNKAILENFSKSFRRIYAILQGFSKDTLSKFKVLYENITTFTKYRFDEPITSLKRLNAQFLRTSSALLAITTIGSGGVSLLTPIGQIIAALTGLSAVLNVVLGKLEKFAQAKAAVSAFKDLRKNISVTDNKNKLVSDDDVKNAKTVQFAISKIFDQTDKKLKILSSALGINSESINQIKSVQKEIKEINTLLDKVGKQDSPEKIIEAFKEAGVKIQNVDAYLKELDNTLDKKLSSGSGFTIFPEIEKDIRQATTVFEEFKKEFNIDDLAPNAINKLISGVNTEIKQLGDGIKKTGPFDSLIKNAKDAYDEVVGNSIIPNLVTEVKSYLDKLDDHTRQAMGPMVNEFEKASDKIQDEMSKGILNPRTIKSFKGIALQLTDEIEVGFENLDIDDTLSGIRGDIKRLDIFDFDITTGLREEVAKITTTFKNIPDSSTEAFTKLKNQFNDAKRDATRLTNILEGVYRGDIKANTTELESIQDAAKKAEARLKAIDEAANNLRNDNIENLEDSLLAIQKIGGSVEKTIEDDATQFKKLTFALGNVGSTLGQVRSGLELTFGAQGFGNRIAGIREAVFGLNSSNNALAKGLDFVVDRFSGADVEMKKLANTALKITEQNAQLTSSFANQIKIINKLAKATGQDSTSLGQLSSLAKKVTSDFNRLNATISATGKVDRRGALALTNDVKTLQQQLSEVEALGLFQPGSAAQKALDQIRKDIDGVEVSTKNLNARVINYEDNVKEAGKSTSLLGGIFGKVFSIFKRESSETTGNLKKANAATRSLKSSTNLLGKAFNTLKSIPGTIYRIYQRINLAGRAVSSLRGELTGLNYLMLNLFERHIVDPLIDGVRRATSEFFRVNTVVQDTEVTLRSMFSGAGLSIEETEKSIGGFFDFIKEETAATPFQLDETLEAGLKLLQQGFDPDEWFRPAANAAAAANKPIEQFLGALTKLAAGSKGIAIDSLRDMGIRVNEVTGFFNEATGEALGFEESQKALAYTVDQLASKGIKRLNFEFDKQGALINDNKEALKILNAFLQQNALYANAAAARQKALSGVLSNIQDNFISLATVAGSPLFERLTIIFTEFLETMNRNMPTLERLAFTIGTKLADASEFAANAIKNSTTAFVGFATFLGRLVGLTTSLIKGDWATAWLYFNSIAIDVVNGLFDALDGALGDFFSWGFNLVDQIADGIHSAINSVLTYAVTSVADLIASFFQAQSPPKEGPLSSIDEWGEPLMNELLKGLQEGDVDLITKALEPVQDLFLEMFPDADIFKGKFGAVRESFAALVAGINETGEIDASLFDKMVESLGEGNDELKALLASQLKLKKVQKKVADAEEAGFVPKELQQELELAQLDTTFKEQDFKSAEKLREEQERQAELSAKKQAQAAISAKKDELSKKSSLEKEANERTYESELDLLKQKKAIGLLTEEEFLQARLSLEQRYAEKALEEGDIGLATQRANAAKSLQEQLEKIKEESKDKQVKTAKEQYDEELALLKQKFELGLINEEEYTQGLIALERQYVERSLKEGVVKGLDLHIQKINELEARLEQFGKSDKTFEALSGDFDKSTALLDKKRDLGIIDQKKYLSDLVSLHEKYVNDVAELDEETLLDADLNQENLQNFVDVHGDITSQLKDQLQVLESTDYSKPYEALIKTIAALENQVSTGTITEEKALDRRKAAYKKFVQDVTKINTQITPEEIQQLLLTTGENPNIDNIVNEYKEEIEQTFAELAAGLGDDDGLGGTGSEAADKFFDEFNKALEGGGGDSGENLADTFVNRLKEKLPQNLEEVSEGIDKLSIVPYSGQAKLFVDALIKANETLPQIREDVEGIETSINNIKDGFELPVFTPIQDAIQFFRDLKDTIKATAAAITLTLVPALGIGLVSNIGNVKNAVETGADAFGLLGAFFGRGGKLSSGSKLVSDRLGTVVDTVGTSATGLSLFSKEAVKNNRVLGALGKTVGKTGQILGESASRIALVGFGPTAAAGVHGLSAAWGSFFSSLGPNLITLSGTLSSLVASLGSGLASLGSLLLPLLPVIAAIGVTIYGVYTNVDLLADLWDDMVDRLDDFISDFDAIWKAWTGQTIEEEIEAFTTGVSALWNAFLADLQALGDSISQIFGGLFTGIEGFVVTVFGPLLNLFNAGFALLTGNIDQAKISAVKAIDSFLEGISIQFSGIGMVISGAIGLAADAVYLLPVTLLDALGLDGLANTIRGNRDTIKDAVEYVFVDSIGVIGDVLSGDLAVSDFITNIVDQINSTIGNLAIDLLSSLGLSQEDIDGVVGSIDTILEKFKEFLDLEELNSLLDELKEAWDSLGKDTFAELGPAIDELKDAFFALFEPLQPYINSFIEWWNTSIDLSAILKVVAGVIAAIVVPALALLFGILKGLVEGIKTFIEGLKNIIAGVSSIFTGIASIVTGFINIITGILTADSEKIKEGLGKVWQGIKDIIWGILSTIMGIVQATFGTVLSYVTGFVSGVIKIFTILYDTLVGNSIIPDIAEGIIYWLGPNLIKEVISNIKNFVATAIQKFVEFKQAAIQTAIDFVVGFVSESANLIIKISEIIGDVVTTIYGWKDNLITAGTDMLGWFVDGILAAKDYVVDSVNTVLEEIRSRTNFSSPADVGPLNVSIQWDAYLADGITEAKPVVSEKVDDVFNSVLIQTDNFSNNFGEKLGSGMKQGFDAAAAGVFDSLNQFVPNLDELVDKDNPYNKLFSSINDSTSQAEAALLSSGQTQIGTTRQYTGEMANVEKTTLQDVLNKWGEVQGKKTGTLAETSTKQTEITKATQDEIVKLSEEANDKIASSNISLFQHFQTLYQRIEEMARAAFRDIAGVVMSATNEQIKAANSLQNAWVRAINNIMSAINRLRQAMRNMPQGPSGRGQGPSGNIGGGRIPQYATGALNIAKDTLAVVHKGETVLPTKIAKPFREFIKSAKDYGLDGVDLTKSRTGAMLNSASNLQTTKVENNTNTFILEAGALSFPNVKDGNGVNSVVQELNKMASMSVARGRVV